MHYKTIDSQVIAQTDLKTCADCPYYVSRRDGTDKGWCNLFNAFARSAHQETQDCINTIASEQAVAQEELNEYVQVQAQTIAPEIEVDSDIDAEFGTLYRVWISYHLLGTFYCALDGSWVAQPVKSNRVLRCATSLKAQAAIITLYGMPDEVLAALANAAA